tara:strand:+ start:6029 stop:6352 length:324 start_codon:yes stop_codon:yes gene_type:complete
LETVEGEILLDKVSQFQKYVGWPWTKDWINLQKPVVALGIGLLKNPVPKLLAWGPGPSPRKVTLNWAQELDHDSRSTFLKGPHGRADRASLVDTPLIIISTGDLLCS